MSNGTTKEDVLDIVQKLPNDVSLETIMAELFLRKKVEEGRKQIRNGETLSHDQVRNEMQRWLK